MRSQVFIATFLATIASASAFAFPHESKSLVRRETCPAEDWCADCYEAGCGNDAITMGVKPNAINVGDVDLNQLADVIAGQCYTDTETGLAGCDPSEVNVTTTLEGGTPANVVVSVSTQSFQSYAKNLFVAAVAAALDGTAKRNTVNGKDQNSITVATIPPSFFVALERLPEQTVTIGMVVEEIPQGDDTCGEILTVGAAIAGAAGPAGAAAGLALTIASVFCGK